MGQELRDMSQVGAKRTGGHRGGIRQKYVLDEPGRNLMKAVYGNPQYGSVSQSIDYLVERLGVPRHVIKNWGQDMGLARIKERNWTPEELAYLEKYYQKPAGKRAAIADIAKHLGRTITSVRIKAKRMKYHRETGDAYTIRGLADALGCDPHKIQRWIDNKWLYAPRDKSREDGRRAIQAHEIRLFILRHPHEVDPRRADWLWLLTILVGNKIQTRKKQDEKAQTAIAQRLIWLQEDIQALKALIILDDNIQHSDARAQINVHMGNIEDHMRWALRLLPEPESEESQ